VRVTPARRRPVLVRSKRRRPTRSSGVTCAANCGRAGPPTTGSATRLAPCVNGLRSAPRSKGGQQEAGLLPDPDLGVGTSLPHVGKRLDDRGLALDELLLADRELFLDAPPLDGLDPLGRVVDGVDDRVGEAALAVLQAQDERGGVDLRSILIAGLRVALGLLDLPAVLVDGLEREAAPGHLDQGHGPGRLGGVALEPLVDGLVGDAQVGVVGQAGDDAGHAEIGHPAAELGLPAIWDRA
jgi:hypothetical protein